MNSRITPVLLILIAGALFFAYINPTYSGAVRDLQSEIHGYDSALSAAQTFEKKEAQLMAEKSGIAEGDLARVETFLPDGVDNVQLILDLNALAARSGLLLSDFNIVSNTSGSAQSSGNLPLQSTSAVDSIDISMTGTGSYGAFKTFLAGTEWSLRPLDLVHLTVNDSPTGVYRYSMTFRIYWLR